MDRRNLFFILLLVWMVLPFYFKASSWLASTEWPRDPDHLRNAGHALSIQAGTPWQDPLYLGEVAWYPPLVPAIIAAISSCLNVPVILVSAKAGVHLNLIAAFLFVLMVHRLLGRMHALIAWAGFLFLLDGGLNAYSETGLSPLLDPINFMLGPFCLGLLAIHRTLDQLHRPVVPILAGTLTGLTFLGHPSAAMILLVTFACIVLIRAFRENGLKRAVNANLRGVLLFTIPFILLVSIQILPLWDRYGMERRNPYFAWIYGDIALVRLDETLMRIPFIPFTLSILGALRSIRRLNTTDVILLSAMGSAILLFLWSSVSSELFLLGRDLPLPMLVVPPYHFFYFFKILLAPFFAIGTMSVLNFGMDKLSARTATWCAPQRWVYELLTGPVSAPRFLIPSGLLLIVATLSLQIAYTMALDPGTMYNHIRKDRPDPGLMDAYDFIQANTGPNDVFLTNDHWAVHLISPSGRKVVCNDALFSNPYVDIVSRRADRDAMWEHLRNGDLAEFQATSAPYSVTHVLVPAKDTFDILGLKALHQVYSDSLVTIFRT